jgi:hypothetical protein
MKITKLMPVLAVLLVFGLANTAFAQLSCGVASTPVSRDTDTGHTEVVGDLIFNCLYGGTPTTTATITVDYGVVITNSTSYPTGKPISILPGPTGVSISSVNNPGGQVVVNVNPQAANLSFTLTGVLASLNGSGKTNLQANVSVSPGTGVLISAGQNVATVVTTILPGIKAPALTSTNPPSSGLILTTGIAVTTGFSVKVDENYIDMYRSQNQYNAPPIPPNVAGTQATNSVILQFAFSNIPTGITLNGCTVSATSGSPSIIGGQTTITAATNVFQVQFTSDVSLTTIDTVTFACTGVSVASSVTIPMAPANIQLTVTLAPTGTALGSSNTVQTSPTAGQIPRYASNPLPSPALTVFSISPAQTAMLIPFAVVNASGYDTGISIANTTLDPFTSVNGNARAQSGTVTFTFYPQTGAACTITPSGTTVGTGFSSGGVIDAGRTVTVLASELLRSAPASAACPTTFTGYVFAVTNFTQAHGASFVSDFRSFTSASPVLVLPPPAQTPRSGVSFESLAH